MTSIKLGPIYYEIKLVKGLMDDAQKTKLSGQINYENCTIELEQTQGIQSMKVILWHEILHHIFFASGHDMENKEDIITALAFGIKQVLDDNPGLR